MLLLFILTLLAIFWLSYRLLVLREQLDDINEPVTGKIAELEWRIKGLERKIAGFERIRN